MTKCVAGMLRRCAADNPAPSTRLNRRDAALRRISPAVKAQPASQRRQAQNRQKSPGQTPEAMSCIMLGTACLESAERAA